MGKAFSRDMVLDPGTFGGSPACHILVDMMNAGAVRVGDKHKLLSFIVSATYNFKWLSIIPEEGVKWRAMTLLRDELYSRIDQWDYNPKVKSLTKNVINHHYRRYLKEAAWTIAP
jgi:hypothetical protein